MVGGFGVGSTWRKVLAAALLGCALMPAAASPADAPAAAGRQALAGRIHRGWGSAEGLPGQAVRALVATPDGLLWVGTDAGLARFDGRAFERFGTDPVRSLTVDREGTLWVGTENQGLLRFRDGHLRRYGKDDGLPSAAITTTCLDGNGQLLVATRGGGVASFSGGLFRPFLAANLFPEPVVAMASQGERLLLASSRSLASWQNGRLQLLPLGSAAATGPRLRALAFGASGEIFLGTEAGLLTAAGGAFRDPFGGRGPRGITSLLADGGGALVIGTLSGLWRGIPASGALEALTPPHPAAGAVVAALWRDPRGVLWFGSLDSGLHQLRENPLRLWGRQAGMTSELTTSVAEDPDGKLWITSRGGGLDRLDPRSGRIESLAAGLPDRDLWSVAVDRAGRLWLGSNRFGLLRRDGPSSWQAFGVAAGLPTGLVQAVEPSSDGAVWAATDQGLVRLVGENLRVFTKNDGLPSNAIRDVFEDRSGTLWIATMGGLARYLGNDRFEAFVAAAAGQEPGRNAAAGNAPEGVLGIWQDEHGALWLSTVGALVQIADGRARALTTRDGLWCDDLSCAIGDRRGNLFMATAKGLVRVSLAELRAKLDGDPTELHQWVFDQRGGLPAGVSSNGTAALVASSGLLYFASRAGLVEVDPAHLEPLPAPPLRLDPVLREDRPWWRSLSPSTSGSRLVFSFAAADLAAPEAMALRYRLAGFDADWRPAGSGSRAEYGRVPPGTYRFELDASDQEGRFAATPAISREVVVPERWALAFAARGLFLILAVALLAGLHRLRMRLLERREAGLAAQVEAALAELAVLGGMLPICSSCKKIRDDQGYWEEMESYFHSHSALEFERGVCPECERRAAGLRPAGGRVIRATRAIGAGFVLLGVLGLPREAAAIGAEVPLGELIASQWTQEDGLAQDTVYTLVQTRDGFLWAGTRAGLSRFDGVRFRNFGRAELRLERSARVQALAEDTAGALWIGTGSGELLRYRNGEFEAFGPADGLVADGRPVGRIASLASGPAGEVWVGTHSEGVYRWAGERFERIAATAVIAPLTRLAVDAEGSLWISSIGKGVFRYREGEKLLNLTRRDGLPNDYVGSVVPSRGGGVLMATHSGICRYHQGRFEVWGAAAGLDFSHVTALREDRSGNVFFATFGGGLQRLRPDGRLERLDPGEPGGSDLAWEVYEDRSGMIWMGTVDQGLRLFSEGALKTWRARGAAGGLASRLVTGLVEDSAGTWWIGSRDAGLAYKRGETFGRIGREQGLAADTVWALARAPGGLLVGTENGLFRVVGGAAEPLELPGIAAGAAVSSLLVDGETLWVGSDRGLLRLPLPRPAGAAGEPGKAKAAAGAAYRLFGRADGLPDDTVRDLERDRAGRLWIATPGGLARLDNDRPRRIKIFDAAAFGQPLVLHGDAAGAMWVVSSSGLVRLAGERAERVDLAETAGSGDGGANHGLYALTEDPLGYFWLGSGQGIVRVARAALEARLNCRGGNLAPTLFGPSDGVDPGAIEAPGKRSALGRDGRVYLATFGGVAVYDPQQPRETVNPRALIETLTVDGKSLAVTANPARPATAFGSDNRNYTFEAAAPLPHAGAKVHLRYRLSGVDPDWVEAGPDGRVSYSGLVPGYYLFEAQASTTSGAYLTQPAQFRFEVAAGFFESWYFPATLLLALSAAAWVFHRVRAHQVFARERELARRITSATAEIRVLNGLLPLCACCHKVRDDQGYWQQVETFLARSTDLEFTHSLCPDCAGVMIDELDGNQPPPGLPGAAARQPVHSPSAA